MSIVLTLRQSIRIFKGFNTFFEIKYSLVLFNSYHLSKTMTEVQSFQEPELLVDVSKRNVRIVVVLFTFIKPFNLNLEWRLQIFLTRSDNVYYFLSIKITFSFRPKLKVNGSIVSKYLIFIKCLESFYNCRVFSSGL